MVLGENNNNCVIETYRRKDSYDDVTILIQSKTAECPKSRSRNKPSVQSSLDHLTEILENEYEKHDQEVMDMINGYYPAKIKVLLQVWLCKTCGMKFPDPGYPYHPKTKATRAYLEFVLERYLNFSDRELANRTEDKVSRALFTDIFSSTAQRYNVSEDALEKARRDFEKKYQNNNIKHPACDTIWLIYFEYHKSPRVVGVGRTVPVKKLNSYDLKADLVLLGFCDASFEDAEKTFKLKTHKADIKKLFVHNEKNLYDDAQEKAYPVWLCDEFTWPDEIEELIEKISKFEKAGIRREHMEFRMFYQNRYKRDQYEVQKVRMRDVQKRTSMYGLSINFDSYVIGNIREQGYAVTDLRQLLASFNQTEDTEHGEMWLRREIFERDILDSQYSTVRQNMLKPKKSPTSEIASIKDQFGSTLNLSEGEYREFFVTEYKGHIKGHIDGQFKLPELE